MTRSITADPSSRRSLLRHATAVAVTAAANTSPLPKKAFAAEEDIRGTRVTLTSPQDRLGLELYQTDNPVGGNSNRSVVAIRRNNIAASSMSSRDKNFQQKQQLVPGMVLQDYPTLDALKARLQQGPYPVTLTFRNLSAGGDAMADTGAPLVTAQDALELAQKTATTTTTTTTTTGAADNFQIQALNTNGKPQCRITSRRNDVLEIQYEASYYRNNNNNLVVYDSSASRGTGQPYQTVLGSGDMLPGVDLGLYDMCPGERRQLIIPPRLAYGSKGNRLFGIPPEATLVWQVELVRINGLEPGDERTRDEIEERVPYSNPR